MRTSLIATVILSGAIFATHSFAQADKPKEADAKKAEASDADAAWNDVRESGQITPPKEWRTSRPSEEEQRKFRLEAGKRFGSGADKAKDFYTRFPKDPRADEAKRMETAMLEQAVSFGNTDASAKLDTLDAAKLKDPSLSEDDRFQLRSKSIELKARGVMSREGQAAGFAEFGKGVEVLAKEFPNRPEVYEMLMEIAGQAEPDKARSLVKLITDSTVASDQVKSAANGLLKKLDLVGKPINLQFTALKGEEVDLSKMKGKVVLIDFWATWCGPCVAELPHVKAAYDQLHPKGFEIVGVSFDQEKSQLDQFLAKEKMAWSQYFDGQGWKNKIGQEYGINSIPSMWLVDKKGIVRDLNGREDLAKKVEKLLAED